MATRESVYLRPNVQVEPLVDQWYAWSYLIPPATAARNLTERHLKIMDSYLSAPQVHAAAVKNPRMLGGPFIDYDAGRVDEIRALRDKTKRRRAALIEVSAALGQLDELLRSEAKGYSLQPLYSRVPVALRGYVELTYDLNNNASFRLVEPLLYKSSLHDTSAQSLMLSQVSGDDRPFVLSTPRLESETAVHIRVPFDQEVVDALFQMKTDPRPLPSIRDRVDLSGQSDELFASFFTPQAPPPYAPYGGKGVRWRYFGHACILVETGGVSIVVDPVLSYTYDSQVSRYTYQDLPERIDYVLITHNHQDHILFETLLQIRHKVSCVVVPRNGGGKLQDPSLRLLLQSAGFRNVLELGELEELTAAGVTITGLPFFGEHADLDVRSKLAYLVRTAKHSLVFAADSCNIEPSLYEHLGAAVGKADALFVGMECDGAPLTWLYGPLLTQRLERAMDESRRLAGSNFEQAMKLVEVFQCREVYVYAMGQEPWLNYVMSIKYTEQSRPIVESNRLLQECMARGIVAERLFGEKEILIE
jgi:L-ascorbate metabolism protein UlaG (beta-lactamase superfamily)